MMDLMSPANSFKIGIVGIPENLKTLVNKDIMYQEVRQPISGDTKSDPKQCVIPVLHSQE